MPCVRPFVVLAALSLAALPAQDARRVELDAAHAKELMVLARTASSQKLHSLAREVAALVVEQYAPDDGSARKLIGEKKVKGEWQSDGTTTPKDAATDRNRAALLGKWRETKDKLGAAHRDLGLALRGEGAAEAVWRPEIELALRFVPKDKQCNEALGRVQIDGFWGTAADVAFVQRFRAMVDDAHALREKDYAVTALGAGDMPVELKNMGVPMFGARGPNYTYWTTGDQGRADNLVRWSERAHELLQKLLGDKAALVRGPAWKWHVVLRTEAERDALLTSSPNTRGPFTLDQAQLFVGIGFAAEGGGRAAATWEPETIDEDYAVANVTKRHLLDLRNDGFGEGLTHAMCWLLCGTTNTYFADLPKTAASGLKPIKRDPDLWFERLWSEIEQHQDQPLGVVAREQPQAFRDSTRLKSWSFMLWMLAAHPDQWMPLLDAVSNIELQPDIVEKAMVGVFGKPIADVEAEWRRWAERDSKLGEVTGWRPSK
ncbi:MAG: hypothetical protein H6835_11180 [Planctomycetes bacterium]|nr:hypothetical protein [Planctomycetota bacterium]